EHEERRVRARLRVDVRHGRWRRALAARTRAVAEDDLPGDELARDAGLEREPDGQRMLPRAWAGGDAEDRRGAAAHGDLRDRVVERILARLDGELRLVGARLLVRVVEDLRRVAGAAGVVAVAEVDRPGGDVLHRRRELEDHGERRV